MPELITLRKSLVSLNRKRAGGGSRAVIIPIEWLDHWERETGQTITEVDVTLGETLEIRPVIDHN